MNLEYPNWKKPLGSRILEFEFVATAREAEKLKCAEEAINNRIQELRLLVAGEY